MLNVTIRRASPGGAVVADFLFVNVDDVLHQQVAWQAVDAVAIQHHSLPAGRTAETDAACHRAGASLKQGGLDRETAAACQHPTGGVSLSPAACWD